MKAKKPAKTSVSERALLVQVIWGRRTRATAAESLRELERLADTAGVKVAGSVTQRRAKPTPGFYVGEGKLADIQLACRRGDADLVVFDNDLSPIQVNNIDLSLGIKVIDRTELILQIFARRARSAEAQIQVELAQLQYLVSRVPVSARQQRFKGGIGMRGPGESPFQLRGEPMRKRISELKKKLARIQEREERTRTRRPWPLVCLAGYTNAGKSTLLNTFASADAYVDDRLFATLDTKTRLVGLGGGAKALISDTVGFIRDLPHGLVASFQSTLQVAKEADLLLVVADSAHARMHEHLGVVNDTLDEIGAGKIPAILVLNKCDLLEEQRLEAVRRQYPDAYAISAVRKTGLDELKAAMRRPAALCSPKKE
ncbi:MAG: GTPase HflX [Kiritimatiellia bacterium]